jgi:hypothetical protein
MPFNAGVGVEGLRAGVPDNLALPSSNVFLFLQDHHCVSSSMILRAVANMAILCTTSNRDLIFCTGAFLLCYNPTDNRISFHPTLRNSRGSKPLSTRPHNRQHQILNKAVHLISSCPSTTSINTWASHPESRM